MIIIRNHDLAGTSGQEPSAKFYPVKLMKLISMLKTNKSISIMDLFPAIL